jgi:hypothetical protein
MTQSKGAELGFAGDRPKRYLLRWYRRLVGAANVLRGTRNEVIKTDMLGEYGKPQEIRYRHRGDLAVGRFGEVGRPAPIAVMTSDMLGG